MSVRTFGKSTLRTSNKTALLERKIEKAAAVAAREMARTAKNQALETFYSDGDGSWPRNEPSTEEWKGHFKPMAGRTDFLVENLGIQNSDRPSAMRIGWFGEEHPDSHLTDAELAYAHEFGLSNDYGKQWPWLSHVADHQPRADAVFKAGISAFKAAVMT